MRPAPSIAGTVTAPIKAPLPAALVQAYRVRSNAGKQQLDLVRTAITGDRGDYRLVWLSPGDYYISASYPRPSVAGPPGVPPNPNIAVHDEGFRAVYYPESPSSAGARIVRVESSDVDGINIALKDAANPATARGRVDPSTPRSSLSGVVARADTPIEERLPNARVELFSGPGTPLITRTDGGGNFAFSNLAAGVYRLRVTRDGYLRQEYGAKVPGEAGETITLAAGQQKNDVRLALDLASSLTGFVLDENGAPSPNVIVQALRPGFDALGNRFLDPAFYTFTDDRGQYRLFWLDPGDYHIGAVVSAQQLELTAAPAKPADAPAKPADKDKNAGLEVPNFAPVYYPGVAEPVDVDPIHVSAGAEGAGIDFRFMPGAPATVRGKVKLPAKEDVVFVSMMPTGNIAAPAPRKTQAMNGAFEIRGVTPGAYTVAAQTPSGYRGFVRITVRDQDVNDLSISMTQQMTIPGQMYVVGGQAPNINGTEIQLVPLETGLPAPLPAPVQPGGGFKWQKVVSGRYLIAATGLPEWSYVSAARVGANNRILEEGVTFSAADKPIEIVIATDGGRLSGTAVGAQDKPAPGARVVLVPEANRRRPDLYRIGESDAKGAFTLHGVPPGNYLLFAWERVESNAYLNAAFLSRFEDQGVSVRVASGESLTATVHVIPALSK
jgi:protocatechuate 3,4-dioxygenase beta subunit